MGLLFSAADSWLSVGDTRVIHTAVAVKFMFG
ncbi:hypothetical protein EPIR_0737 [Erwinia piriflorinigrans CFBP 5888]|uniref:Uncharacterized protein n=1 Tax=Erwinia piriflorinigrans CFBP 5888 TaxID=1161919 RepID=V5Z4A1_9GAMM|nr:hypothetical protein EPIR_0737 [Erwinia piriflorinigrans CFBP 5888]